MLKSAAPDRQLAGRSRYNLQSLSIPSRTSPPPVRPSQAPHVQHRQSLLTTPIVATSRSFAPAQLIRPILHNRYPPRTTHSKMVSRIVALLLSSVAILQVQAQTLPTDIIGTWNSKANSTQTGPVRYMHNPWVMVVLQGRTSG